MVGGVSNEMKELRIPTDGYRLVRDIKNIDGRLDFLNTWTTEVKKHMAANRRSNFDGMEVVGSDGVRKRLRVINRPAARVARFDYERFKGSVERRVYEQTVLEIAPARPKTLRIAAALPGKRSLEWCELESDGRKDEERKYTSRNDWRSASAKVMAGGLFTLNERIKALGDEKDALRYALIDMAVSQDWDDYLWGHYDGRIVFGTAKPRRELRDRDAAMAKYYSFVRHTENSGTTTVGFYPVKEDED